MTVVIHKIIGLEEWFLNCDKLDFSEVITMWKKWEDVTESEREEIAKISQKYEEPIGRIAGMFQGGMSFAEISSTFERN